MKSKQTKYALLGLACLVFGATAFTVYQSLELNTSLRRTALNFKFPRSGAHSAQRQGTFSRELASAVDEDEGGHAVKAAVSQATLLAPTLGFDEVLVSLAPVGETPHSLALRLEMELFAEGSRALLEQRQSGVKHTIIETALEQEFGLLATLAGKLHFKEVLVSRINEFMNEAIIRDIHFTSFQLQ